MALRRRRFLAPPVHSLHLRRIDMDRILTLLFRLRPLGGSAARHRPGRM